LACTEALEARCAEALEARRVKESNLHSAFTETRLAGERSQPIATYPPKFGAQKRHLWEGDA